MNALCMWGRRCPPKVIKSKINISQRTTTRIALGDLPNVKPLVGFFMHLVIFIAQLSRGDTLLQSLCLRRGSILICTTNIQSSAISCSAITVQSISHTTRLKGNRKAIAQHVPTEDICTKCAPDDIAQMRDVIAVRQSRCDQNVCFSIFWKSVRWLGSDRNLRWLILAHIAASPGGGMERKTPSAGLILVVIVDGLRMQGI